MEIGGFIVYCKNNPPLFVLISAKPKEKIMINTY